VKPHRALLVAPEEGGKSMRKTNNSIVIAAAIIGAALLLNGSGAGAGEPANKTSAAGSKVVVSAPGEVTTLLSERVKTAAPTDLILGVTAECAITTALTTVGNDAAEASGKIEMWIEIDGHPVGVTSADQDGKVTFCNRIDRRTTTEFDDEDATIDTYQLTKQSNGFNWMALNVGAATHLIEVKALLTIANSGDATATAAVGNRTLIVEPVHAAVNEAVTDLATS
jgi:hypothetical protein